MDTAGRETPLERARHAVETANRAAGSAPRARIGILTPLSDTGWVVAGELMTRGACLAADYVREHGGLPGGAQLELVLQDDQETAAREPMVRSAVGGMAKLAIVDEVLAVLGQWHVRTTPKVAELAERLGVPHFLTTGHSTVTAQRYRTVFRTFYSIEDRARLLVRFMAEHGARRIAIIAADSLFGKMFAAAVQRLAGGEPYGLAVLREDYDQERATEISAELARIKAWRPDFVVNLGIMVRMTAHDVVTQAAAAGLRPGVPMVVGIPFPSVSADFWRLVGEAGNLIVWPSSQFRPGWPGMTAIGRWFVERHTTAYGSFPSEMTLTAFTNVTIVAQALRRARALEREALLDALESGSFETWCGPVSFERGAEHWHHSPPTIQLMQYQHVGQSLADAAVVYPPELKTHDYLAPQPAAGAAAAP